jgi:hypothetical protein
VREGRTDRLVLLDLDDGATRVIAESTPTPFELGDGVFDPTRDELLVPDGNLRALRRFEARELREGEPLSLDGPCLRLPPRQVTLTRNP